MLVRLFIWLCRRMTIHSEQYKSGTHVNGYVRYIGPFMVDWERDTWQGKDRGTASVSAMITSESINKAPPLRLYIERVFIWLCMVITKRFGEQWFAWGLDDATEEDHNLSIGKDTSVGWGKCTRHAGRYSYAEIHTRQYASNKPKHKVRYIHRPFKGGSGYEWQVMGFVFMLYYPHAPMVPDRKKWRLGFFWDTYWTGRCTPSPLAKLVTWLSRKGEEIWDDDLSEKVLTIGPLIIKSGSDSRLNYYSINWGKRRLWKTAN